MWPARVLTSFASSSLTTAHRQEPICRFLRLKGDRLIMRSHNVLNRIKTAMSLLYLLAVDGCHLQMHASRNPSSLHAVTSEDG